MKVTYTPAEGESQVFEFDPDDVDQDEAEQVEKRYGRNWDEFGQDVRQGSARARKVLLWHLLRRAHPAMRFEDTPRFKMGAVKVEHSLEELLVLRDRVAKSNLEDEQKDGVLAALDLEITEATGDSTAETEPGKDSVPQT